MPIFDSADIYINSACDLKEKIKRIDKVIVALENMALTAAATGNLSSYSLDDGQTKISTSYRNVGDIAASINAFEFIKQRYMNQLTGRHVRLFDSKNFRGS